MGIETGGSGDGSDKKPSSPLLKKAYQEEFGAALAAGRDTPVKERESAGYLQELRQLNDPRLNELFEEWDQILAFRGESGARATGDADKINEIVRQMSARLLSLDKRKIESGDLEEGSRG